MRRETKARAVCSTCPVLDACRAWARERGEYGFWGGESEEERAAAGYFVALPTGRVARVIREIGGANQVRWRPSARPSTTSASAASAVAP